MKTIELPTGLRQNRSQLSMQLQAIESRISERIRAEFESEISEIKSEKDNLWAIEKQFRADAIGLVKTLVPGDRIRVKTTWGKNDENEQEYIGVFTKKLLSDCFNMVAENTNYKGEFTIGSSCLSYIEVL